MTWRRAVEGGRGGGGGGGDSGGPPDAALLDVDSLADRRGSTSSTVRHVHDTSMTRP